VAAAAAFVAAFFLPAASATAAAAADDGLLLLLLLALSPAAAVAAALLLKSTWVSFVVCNAVARIEEERSAAQRNASSLALPSLAQTPKPCQTHTVPRT
jgi:hypothetical protein